MTKVATGWIKSVVAKGGQGMVDSLDDTDGIPEEELAQALSAIVATAQTVDGMLLLFFSRTYGLQVYPSLGLAEWDAEACAGRAREATATGDATKRKERAKRSHPRSFWVKTIIEIFGSELPRLRAF